MRVGKVIRSTVAFAGVAAAGLAAAGLLGPGIRAATKTLTDVTTAPTEATVTVADEPSTAPTPTVTSPRPDPPPVRATQPPPAPVAPAPTRSRQPAAARPPARTAPPRAQPLRFRFQVGRAGPVQIVVRALAPRCRVVWMFSLDAPAGWSSVDLAHGPGGARLGAGRYAVVARRAAATIARTTIAVGAARPTGTCPPPRRHRAQRQSPVVKVVPAPKRRAMLQPAPRRSGVLGTRHDEALLPNSDGDRTALMIILGAATFLLAIAALPRQLIPSGAAGTWLVRRRATAAVAGLASLAAFLVTYFLH